MTPDRTTLLRRQKLFGLPGKTKIVLDAMAVSAVNLRDRWGRTNRRPCCRKNRSFSTLTSAALRSGDEPAIDSIREEL